MDAVSHPEQLLKHGHLLTIALMVIFVIMFVALALSIYFWYRKRHTRKEPCDVERPLIPNIESPPPKSCMKKGTGRPLTDPHAYVRRVEWLKDVSSEEPIAKESVARESMTAEEIRDYLQEYLRLTSEEEEGDRKVAGLETIY